MDMPEENTDSIFREEEEVSNIHGRCFRVKVVKSNTIYRHAAR